jgi:hypothetical protein
VHSLLFASHTLETGISLVLSWLHLMMQVRAFEELELMPQIQYLASVSGGSWFSTLYYYYQAGFEVS